MKKLLLSIFLVLSLVVLIGCKPDEGDKDKGGEEEKEWIIDPLPADQYEHTSLNVAINYKLNDSFANLSSITWQGTSPYVSTVDGKTYSKGDLLPVWKFIGDRLNVSFNDAALSSDTDTNAQWTRLVSSTFEGIDLVNGTASNIATQGTLGKFVNFEKYLEEMPNLDKFLTENPNYRPALTAFDKGIYSTPYFDGLNEFEQINLMRVDWVKDLLDEANPSFDTTPAVKPNHYDTRVVPTPISTKITVANAAGGTRDITKAYSVNPLDAIKNAGPTGADVATAFKNHIQTTYGAQGYAKLSDVFVGTDAAYDTDELVALYYVIKSNPRYLTRELATPLDSVEVIFPRESAGNRVRNIIRSLENWGIKGVASKFDYLYYNAAGLLEDSRRDQKTQQGITNLNNLYQDGIIVNNIPGTSNWAEQLVKGSKGFTEYDYNASQTPISWVDAGKAADATFEWQSVLPPVNNWKGDGEYFHFTEFVRNGKNEAWGVPAYLEWPGNEVKLHRALLVVDQMYNMTQRESIGTVNLYGPSAWGTNVLSTSPSLGTPIIELNAACMTELNDPTLGKGNMINYLRRFLGATMPIGHVRDMGLELQTLSDQGRIGYDRVSTAFKAGTFRLGGVYKTNDPWYSVAAVSYPIKPSEQTYISNSFVPIVDVFKDSNYVNLIQSHYDWADFNAVYTNVLYNFYITAYRNASKLGVEQPK